MFPAQNASLDDSKTPPLYFWVMVLSVVVALVPTLWTDLDLRAAALFSGPTPAIASVHWWWVELINLYVPAIFRVGIAIAIVVWLVATVRKQSKSLRLAMAFLVLAGILGPGIVVNWGFKDHWQRARPYQVENFGGTQQFTRAAVMTDQCNNNCSFVSGHVACGFFFTSLVLIHRRRKVTWAIIGSVAGLAIGFARMSDMAHWFSDVLWAYPITLATCWLTWKALLWAYAGDRSPSRTVG
jgi:lipid A 4'-phosphatase